jgi:hypothetical protein
MKMTQACRALRVHYLELVGRRIHNLMKLALFRSYVGISTKRLRQARPSRSNRKASCENSLVKFVNWAKAPSQTGKAQVGRDKGGWGRDEASLLGSELWTVRIAQHDDAPGEP